ncbi:hypothetical protein O9992_27465 [Vibrio lentus]|nr:hypothetical protein [Vibrio lentus]
MSHNRDEVLLSERRGAFELVILESVKLNALTKQRNLFHNLSEIQQSVQVTLIHDGLMGVAEYGIPYAWGTSGICAAVIKVRHANFLDNHSRT